MDAFASGSKNLLTYILPATRPKLKDPAALLKPTPVTQVFQVGVDSLTPVMALEKEDSLLNPVQHFFLP